MALPGIGALQGALDETNTHLAAVLRELRETNNEKLDQVVQELRSLNDKLDRLAAREQH
jgi:hypothetical protein